MLTKISTKLLSVRTKAKPIFGIKRHCAGGTLGHIMTTLLSFAFKTKRSGMAYADRTKFFLLETYVACLSYELMLARRIEAWLAKMHAIF